MGEYYEWCNVDKNERISPHDFQCGSKRYETSWEGNPFLMALFELMETDWKGDKIVWLGDEALEPGQEIPVISDLYRKAAASGYSCLTDYQYEKMQNIDKQFRKARDMVMNAYRVYQIYGDTDEMEEYGLAFENPEEGCFHREGVWFRYVINETKKEYVDQHEKYHADADGGASGFPSLLGFGRMYPEGGAWLGDQFTLSDTAPGEGYKQIHIKEIFEHNGRTR